MNFVYKRIYELFVNVKKLSLYRYFYAKTLTSIFYKIVDTKIMTNEEKTIVFEEMQWFFKQRKKVKIEPCQKTLNIIFEKIDDGNFKEAVELLSNVRLGCELSLLNIEKSKINQLNKNIFYKYFC